MSLFDEEFYKILVRNILSFISIYKNYNGFIFYKVKLNNGHQEGDKMAIKVWGIDVSKYNHPIDWKKVKNAGVKFAILRVGFASTSNRHNLYLDPYFEEFYRGAKEVGMPVGVYFYSRCNSIQTARREAEFILNAIKGKQFEYPIWLDVEDITTLNSTSRSALTRAVVTCLEEIKKAGYYVGIYSGKYILRDKLDDEDLKQYDHWIAQYATRSTYTTYKISMWQFGGEVNFLTSKKIPGIGSNVADQNYCYKDYPTIIKSSGLNGFEKNYLRVELPFYIKTLGKVNIRKSPNIHSQIIYTVPKEGIRYKITKLSENGEWGYVPYRDGWITLNKNYVKKGC